MLKFLLVLAALGIATIAGCGPNNTADQPSFKAIIHDDTGFQSYFQATVWRQDGTAFVQSVSLPGNGYATINIGETPKTIVLTGGNWSTGYYRFNGSPIYAPAAQWTEQQFSGFWVAQMEYPSGTIYTFYPQNPF